MIPTSSETMDLQEQLAAALQGTVVVMGIGNPCRGDDAAGSLIARKIGDVCALHVIDAQDVPESHLYEVAIRNPAAILLIDSVDLHVAPGSVALLQKDQTGAYWPSTHRLPISLLMDYLERETHARVLLLAIQPKSTEFGEEVSEGVSSTVDIIAELLRVASTARRMSVPSESIRELKKVHA